MEPPKETQNHFDLTISNPTFSLKHQKTNSKTDSITKVFCIFCEKKMTYAKFVSKHECFQRLSFLTNDIYNNKCFICNMLS